MNFNLLSHLSAFGSTCFYSHDGFVFAPSVLLAAAAASGGAHCSVVVGAHDGGPSREEAVNNFLTALVAAITGTELAVLSGSARWRLLSKCPRASLVRIYALAKHRGEARVFGEDLPLNGLKVEDFDPLSATLIVEGIGRVMASEGFDSCQK
jgi:hypothetical protein